MCGRFASTLPPERIREICDDLRGGVRTAVMVRWLPETGERRPNALSVVQHERSIRTNPLALTHGAMICVAFIFVALSIASSEADAQPDRRAPTAAPMTGQALPYIDPGSLPDTTKILPEPPGVGTPSQASDEAIFRRTRSLEGTPRWTLAQHDAVLNARTVVDDFSCALGTKLSPADAPALFKIFDRASGDIGPMFQDPKDQYRRVRPFVGNDLPICVARTARLSASPSYPSGHTTIEFSVALILAELAPDRGSEILARGRTLGESRIVCGVHWASDVEAGYLSAAVFVAALHGSRDFRSDLEMARRQVALARSLGVPKPDSTACNLERAAEETSVLFTSSRQDHRVGGPHP